MIKLTQEQLQKLADFIQKRTGIFLDEQKLKRVEKKVELLLEKHKIDDFLHFYHQIRFGKDEELMRDLISTITINETYFWREYEQFLILANEILPKIAQQKQKIRILVAPTSSGEELYSIMFAILEEAQIIKDHDIELIGIDIDAAMIRKAQVGLYTQRSVSKLPKEMLERYFTKVGSFYQLDKMFLKSAKFLQANIFDEALPEKLGMFDVIFSRNMLIYFEHQDRVKVFHQFYKMLYPNGYLFLGHADANSIDKTMFTPQSQGFHIYQKIRG